MRQPAEQGFSQRVADLKSRGLKDIKFYPGIISETVPEQFCAEANRLIDVVEQGRGRKLVFGDSKKK
ncbi:MAG: hypothetical protein AB7U63_01760 [Porticoccaceae bacterium]